MEDTQLQSRLNRPKNLSHTPPPSSSILMTIRHHSTGLSAHHVELWVASQKSEIAISLLLWHEKVDKLLLSIRKYSEMNEEIKSFLFSLKIIESLDNFWPNIYIHVQFSTNPFVNNWTRNTSLAPPRTSISQWQHVPSKQKSCTA